MEIHEAFVAYGLGTLTKRDRTNYSLQVAFMACPACDTPILKLLQDGPEKIDYGMVFPRHSVRPLAAPEVPDELAKDYNEAGLVLADSPKASAALSRRCLQALLRVQGFEQRDLVNAIEAVLKSGALPSWLAESLDAVRIIGNFAAHPVKNTNTGEIVEVEEREGEWNLDVLEGLFDFYYVQPARDAVRRAALNAKLAAVGKPLLKSAPQN
ncbi:DUF4145 domain-containing protein [Paracidovorax sp. MALMAid1276]|uniref:DUF4145 domain-containing protein n=1 Tax=Paracidovorax sp. MALMAid1276 TaxID=3411631 RepID=UPI003B9A6E6C